MEAELPEYLTTREVAELLRLKERKVYDLVSSGTVPCSKATGKLLFPREAITQWVRQHGSGGAEEPNTVVPLTFLGSHDPLLDWALRESRCGIPTLFESSVQGLNRFIAGEGVATGLHVYEAASDTWNQTLVARECADMPVVLTEWAKRQRGLIVGQHLAGQITSLADLADYRFVKRQDGAGSQQLLVTLLDKQHLCAQTLNIVSTELNEQEAVLRVLEGKADVTFGLESLARQFRLPFVPLVTERFDLLMNRRTWFQPPVQQLLAFCRSKEFAGYAKGLSGYDVDTTGTVHFNGR